MWVQDSLDSPTHHSLSNYAPGILPCNFFPLLQLEQQQDLSDTLLGSCFTHRSLKGNDERPTSWVGCLKTFSEDFIQICEIFARAWSEFLALHPHFGMFARNKCANPSLCVFTTGFRGWKSRSIMTNDDVVCTHTRVPCLLSRKGTWCFLVISLYAPTCTTNLQNCAASSATT